MLGVFGYFFSALKQDHHGVQISSGCSHSFAMPAAAEILCLAWKWAGPRAQLLGAPSRAGATPWCRQGRQAGSSSAATPGWTLPGLGSSASPQQQPSALSSFNYYTLMKVSNELFKQ